MAAWSAPLGCRSVAFDCPVALFVERTLSLLLIRVVLELMLLSLVELFGNPVREKRVLQISQLQMDRMAETACQSKLPLFRDFLIRTGTLVAGQDRDDELRAYVRSGWSLGLRRPKELLMFCVACFQADGDIGRIGSVRKGIADRLDDPGGPMTRLMLDRPITYWSHLGGKLKGR